MLLETTTQTNQVPPSQPTTSQNPTTPTSKTTDSGEQSPNGDAGSSTQSSESQYDPREDHKVQKFVSQIRSRRKRNNEAIRDDGEDLWKLKQYLKCHDAHHGHWERICKEDLDTHPRTAHRKIQYYHAWERAKSEGKSDIMSEIDPSVIYRVCAPTVPNTAFEEVVRRAADGEKITCKEAGKIVERHQSGQGGDSKGDERADSSAGSTADDPGANDNEASEAGEIAAPTAGVDKTKDVDDDESRAVNESKKTTEDESDGTAETGATDKSSGEPDAHGDSKAGATDKTGATDKAASEPDRSGAAEDEDAIRLIGIFASAISAAEDSFFKMDNQTKQKALKRARKKHLDFLNAITALAS